MIEVKLSKSLAPIYPHLKIGLLEIKNINNKYCDSGLETEKRNLECFIKDNYTDLENIKTIEKYGQFYKKFGKTYPIQFQIRSIATGKKLPTRSTVVESMFMAELKNMYLTACHNLDTIVGPIEIKTATGIEEYTNINGKDYQLIKEDIIAQDSIGIIASVLYGPDKRTMINLLEKNIVFISYFPYGEENNKIINHFQDIISYLKIFDTGFKVENQNIISMASCNAQGET
jgi:DNA/RNA-binding domain of Phe-tRNA-synthetase-like protein